MLLNLSPSLLTTPVTLLEITVSTHGPSSQGPSSWGNRGTVESEVVPRCGDRVFDGHGFGTF